MTGLSVRAFSPDEWEMLRDLRLRALAEAPEAFGSSHAREVGYDEAMWRSRAENMAVALDDGRPVGIVGAIVPDGKEVQLVAVELVAVELVAMWVDPVHRRAGAGHALVTWVLARARAAGRGSVGLWVAEGNEEGVALYSGHGFVETGETEPIASDPTRLQRRMVAGAA